MPAQRKPSSLQERKGAYRKDPQRRRKDPKGKGTLPASPPAHLRLSAALAEIWREVVAALPPAVATGSDRFVVERLVRLLARSRSPRAAWKAADESQLRAYLNSLGLSPAARANLAGAGGEEEKNPFERFGRGRSARGGADANLPN